MFVKKKPNISGSTTVVVVEKEKGASRYLKTIGTSSDSAEIAEYVRQGEAYIASCRAALNPELDFDGAVERAEAEKLKATEDVLSRIENVYHDAPKRILDRVFDAVGFHTVSDDGCPLAYSIHEGAKYEGHTMLPVVTAFVKKYELEDFIVVADYGMMSEANVSDLETEGYKYIIGARIRNMTEETTRWILSQKKRPDVVSELVLDDEHHKRLLVGYSGERAALDAKNREEGVKKLRTKYATGTVTKSKITQRGYNRFLKVTGGDRITVVVDEDLVAADAKWDGLKGYISNAGLPAQEIVSAYHQLYNVEQSFRITKSKLEIRPIFHFNHNRIKAHISICFVALKVYRELDRLLKKNKMNMSVDTVLSIAKTIPTISVKLDEQTLTRTLFLTERQQLIKLLFEETFWGSQTSTENQ